MRSVRIDPVLLRVERRRTRTGHHQAYSDQASAKSRYESDGRIVSERCGSMSTTG
jgi:hypothetical protein